jgi:hypothetical protein
MLSLKQKQPNPEASQREVELRWNVLSGDLSLFVALTIARFIVWRTLRLRRKERAARRKQFRLIQGSDHHAAGESSAFLNSGDPKCWT